MQREQIISAFTNTKPQTGLWRFLHPYRSAEIKKVSIQNDTDHEQAVKLELFAYRYSDHASNGIIEGTAITLFAENYKIPAQSTQEFAVDVPVPTEEEVGFLAQLIDPESDKALGIEWHVKVGSRKTLPASCSYYSRLKKIQARLYERTPSLETYKTMLVYTDLLLHDDSIEDDFFYQLKAQIEAGVRPVIAEELGDSNRFYTRLFAEIRAIQKSIENQGEMDLMDYGRPYEVVTFGVRANQHPFNVAALEHGEQENEGLVSDRLLKHQLSTQKTAVLVVDLCGVWAGKIPCFDQNNYEFLKSGWVSYLCLDRVGKQELKHAITFFCSQKGVEHAVFIRGEADVSDLLRVNALGWEKQLYL